MREDGEFGEDEADGAEAAFPILIAADGADEFFGGFPFGERAALARPIGSGGGDWRGGRGIRADGDRDLDWGHLVLG